jgi:hypothetical protein
LAKLDAKVGIHGAMRAGFASLYGSTSDEKGIRHALLEVPAASVDKTDALFMIGACAAFVSYLLSKAHAAGLIPRAWDQRGRLYSPARRRRANLAATEREETR